jgi:phosphotransferase system HPr (HPr) family protein
MISQTITVQNKSGLHARPASDFVRMASRYKSNVTVGYKDMQINAKSIINVLAAGIIPGSEILIEVNGPDENEALAELIALVKSNFGED